MCVCVFKNLLVIRIFWRINAAETMNICLIICECVLSELQNSWDQQVWEMHMYVHGVRHTRLSREASRKCFSFINETVVVSRSKRNSARSVLAMKFIYWDRNRREFGHSHTIKPVDTRLQGHGVTGQDKTGCWELPRFPGWMCWNWSVLYEDTLGILASLIVIDSHTQTCQLRRGKSSHGADKVSRQTSSRINCPVQQENLRGILSSKQTNQWQ